MTAIVRSRWAAAVAASALGAAFLLLASRRSRRSRRPSGPQLEDLHHQVGGHSGADTGFKLYNGRVLKRFQNGSRGEREGAFYVAVQAVPSLLPFVPAYYGDVSLDVDGATIRSMFLPVLRLTFGVGFMELENLVADLAQPCVMDIKVGTKSYEPTASEAKIALEQAKFPLQATVGFRLLGFQTHRRGACERYDRSFCKALQTMPDVLDAVVKYFPDDPAARAVVVAKLMTKLEALLSWLETNVCYHFIASSLLFVYDAASPESCDVRLIDFAHVQLDATTRDEGVITGVTTLLEMFASFQDA
ncbi:inositol polyphosphate multikinase [Achlya hypogyna]|uniref:Kinase n=1 Tax=Achlya hypogyna TaxID=1202772 RepID=A0A1V9YLJ8_ACHHY|nr:inositol polyphosphate multikinase [Achlya hypogyna]